MHVCITFSSAMFTLMISTTALVHAFVVLRALSAVQPIHVHLFTTSVFSSLHFWHEAGSGDLD